MLAERLHNLAEKQGVRAGPGGLAAHVPGRRPAGRPRSLRAARGSPPGDGGRRIGSRCGPYLTATALAGGAREALAGAVDGTGRDGAGTRSPGRPSRNDLGARTLMSGQRPGLRPGRPLAGRPLAGRWRPAAAGPGNRPAHPRRPGTRCCASWRRRAGPTGRSPPRRCSCRPRPRACTSPTSSASWVPPAVPPRRRPRAHALRACSTASRLTPGGWLAPRPRPGGAG